MRRGGLFLKFIILPFWENYFRKFNLSSIELQHSAKSVARRSGATPRSVATRSVYRELRQFAVKGIYSRRPKLPGFSIHTLGCSHQSVHQFYTAPRPAGLILRPVSTPLERRGLMRGGGGRARKGRRGPLARSWLSRSVTPSLGMRTCRLSEKELFAWRPGILRSVRVCSRDMRHDAEGYGGGSRVKRGTRQKSVCDRVRENCPT